MQRIALMLISVALVALGAIANVSAQEPDTVLDLLLSAIDDTTCGDGVGRTFRGETLIAAVEQDDMENFFARHESCAGISGVTAALGKVPLSVGLTSRCSAAV